jgi:uncharacterized membrane protein YeaQ/YmgE (transglycosylase-associated protein family)
MNSDYWFWFLLMGIVAGWIAGEMNQGYGFGLVGNLVVGIVGAVGGGLLFKALGLTYFGFGGAVMMSMFGAVGLLIVLSRMSRV